MIVGVWSIRSLKNTCKYDWGMIADKTQQLSLSLWFLVDELYCMQQFYSVRSAITLSKARCVVFLWVEKTPTRLVDSAKCVDLPERDCMRGEYRLKQGIFLL